MVVDELSDEDVDRLFHTLPDVARRDILHRCIDGEPSASRLAETCPLSFAAVHRHVAVRHAGGHRRAAPLLARSKT